MDDLSRGQSTAPDFENWESAETHVRWERGLLIVAGMIAVPLVFFALYALLPVPWDADDEPSVSGAQTAAVPQVGAPAAAPAIVPPSPTATGTPALPDGRLTAIAQIPPNARRSPSVSPDNIVTTFPQGQRLELVGRTNDAAWVQVINPQNPDQRLWVSADLLQISGDVRSLPVAQ